MGLIGGKQQLGGEIRVEENEYDYMERPSKEMATCMGHESIFVRAREHKGGIDSWKHVKSTRIQMIGDETSKLWSKEESTLNMRHRQKEPRG